MKVRFGTYGITLAMLLGTASAAWAEPIEEPAAEPRIEVRLDDLWADDLWADQGYSQVPWEPYYLDPQRGPTLFEPEYERWFGESRRPKHYGRAALELAAILAVGETYYWIVSDPNRPDWDFPDWQTRMSYLEVRFDNNMFRTNHLLHPLAGMMSYWTSRANGLNIYESAIYATVSSSTFEFLLEWLEKASINDLIVTPAGGVAAGEFFFHLGDYLNSALGHDTALQRSLAFTMGFPQAIHQPLDGIHTAPAATPDSLGYSSAYWHRFSVGYGVALVDDERSTDDVIQDLHFDADLVAMPGFLRPGHFGVDFSQGNFTDAHLRTSISRGYLTDMDLKLNANLVGTYQQDFEGTARALKGSAYMVAESVNMRYVDRWLLHRRDQLAVFNLIGSTAEFWIAPFGGLMLHAKGDAHLDFAAIRSPAYQDWLSAFGPDGTKSVLQLQNYYFGAGGSARVAAGIEYGSLQLEGSAAIGAYRSIDGWDREQTITPYDVTNYDQIRELGVSVALSPPDTPFAVRLGWDELQHKSEMAGFNADLVDRRTAVSASVKF
jgi:Domain of unknown function (DUF3943)